MPWQATDTTAGAPQIHGLACLPDGPVPDPVTARVERDQSPRVQGRRPRLPRKPTVSSGRGPQPSRRPAQSASVPKGPCCPTPSAILNGGNVKAVVEADQTRWSSPGAGGLACC